MTFSFKLRINYSMRCELGTIKKTCITDQDVFGFFSVRLPRKTKYWWPCASALGHKWRRARVFRAAREKKKRARKERTSSSSRARPSNSRFILFQARSQMPRRARAPVFYYLIQLLSHSCWQPRPSFTKIQALVWENSFAGSLQCDYCSHVGDALA